jgi:hypothetical protein
VHNSCLIIIFHQMSPGWSDSSLRIGEGAANQFRELGRALQRREMACTVPEMHRDIGEVAVKTVGPRWWE